MTTLGHRNVEMSWAGGQPAGFTRRFEYRSPLRGFQVSPRVGIFANRHDAAGLNRPDIEGHRALDQGVAFGARVEPYLRDALFRHLVDHALTDVGRHIEGGHVNRARHLEHGRVGLDPLDLRFVRVDRQDRESLLDVRAQRAIAELPAITRCANHCDDFLRHIAFARSTRALMLRQAQHERFLGTLALSLSPFDVAQGDPEVLEGSKDEPRVSAPPPRWARARGRSSADASSLHADSRSTSRTKCG